MPSDVFGLDVVYDRQVDSNWPESSNYGYFAGGSTPPPSYVCTIDRLDFSSETVSEPSSELTQARNGLEGVSNSNYGYFGGGSSPSYVCTIDRLDFSNETVSAPSSNLTNARIVTGKPFLA